MARGRTIKRVTSAPRRPAPPAGPSARPCPSWSPFVPTEPSCKAVHQLILLPGRARSEPFRKPSWLGNNSLIVWSRPVSAGVGMSLVSCTRRRRSNSIRGRVMHQHLRPLNVNAIHLIPLRQHGRGQGCEGKILCDSFRSFKFRKCVCTHINHFSGDTSITWPITKHEYNQFDDQACIKETSYRNTSLHNTTRV